MAAGASGAATAARSHAVRLPPTAEAGTISHGLQILARAIQQHRTYPSNSPLCRTAMQAAHQAIRELGEEQMSFRITPRDVIVGDEPIGGGTPIEPEIAGRLHAAGIAQVTIEKSVTLRELSHFAADLIACSRQRRAAPDLIERLTEHGVDRITLRPAHRPEVLSVAAPPAPVVELMAAERDRRARRFAAGGYAAHLYPPDKGWVCVDPSTTLPSVSLMDLALLAEHPADLAGLLVRLTHDDAADGGDKSAALTEKFSDVSRLFAAFDPGLARVLFAKLARAVLDLDSERRQALLRRTILPSLLDGGVDGTVLRDFPDVDLAESLCLLLDLETAAPDVVTTALARLDLERDREAAVLPLIGQRLQHRGVDREELSLDAHARRLVRIDHRGPRSFAEFSAFDLSLDEAAAGTLARIREGLCAADLLIDQLSCLWQLIRLEPNPERVQTYVSRSEPLLEDLGRQGRWREVSEWLARVRGFAESARETRPDVATVVDVQLAALCGAGMVRTIVDLAGRSDEDREIAGRLVGSLGAGVATALLTALPREGRSRGLVELLCQHGRLLAPSLVLGLGQIDDAADRVIVRVLGWAGPGHEDTLAGLLKGRDEQTVREALRGLARIGTPRAAALVGRSARPPRSAGVGGRTDALAVPSGRSAARSQGPPRPARIRPRPSLSGHPLARSARAAGYRRHGGHAARHLRPPVSFLESRAEPPGPQGARPAEPMTHPPPVPPRRLPLAADDPAAPALDPVALFRAFVSLRRLTGMYPAGHPAIVSKLAELDQSVQGHLADRPVIQLDIIHGAIHLDGVSFRQDRESDVFVRELTDLGIDSLHIRRGVTSQEILALSTFLWQMKDVPAGETVQTRLDRLDIRHVTLGRLLPLDTRWQAHAWPDAPAGPLDPAYAESLALTARTFDDVATGRGVDLLTVRQIVELLIRKVAGSSAALGQILAVKLYENLTYCHSVNVATLSLLIGRQLGLDALLTSALAEAALLHDIGKTRIPLEVLKKPGALDKRERTLMENHTILGAEILVEVPGLQPLTPTVALEHHRAFTGSGYPDFGAPQVPHMLTQIVSVADIYEAMTGARSYQDPATPEQACLVLARLAGTKLNTALVKAFVNTIGFFPLGSLVRTSRDDIGVVVGTNPAEPLHPVIALVDEAHHRRPGDVDTSRRTAAGDYACHVVETLRPPPTLDLNAFLASPGG